MYGSIPTITIPPGHTPGIYLFFFLGGLFRTPRHVERDNSLPLGLEIKHKYAFFVQNKDKSINFCTNSKATHFLVQNALL